MMKGRAGLAGLVGLMAAVANNPTRGGGAGPRPNVGYQKGASTLTGPERKERKDKNKRAAKARRVSRGAR